MKKSFYQLLNLILILLSLNAFTQEDESVEDIMGDDLNSYNIESEELPENNETPETITTTTTTTTEVSVTKKNTSNLDKMIDSVGSLKDKVFNNDSSGDKKDGLAGEGAFNSVVEKMKDSMIKDFMKQNPFSLMPRSKVKDMILTNTKGKGMGKFLRDNPKHLEFITDIAHDQKALPSFFGILNKQKELQRFAYASIFFLVLSFIVSMMIKETNFIKKLFKKLGISLFFMGLNIGLFYFYFGKEIDPILSIIKRNYFSF